MRTPLGLLLVAALMTASCSSSSSTETTEPGGFLLPPRTEEMGVDATCIEAADSFLEAMREHVVILGEGAFADWVTEGLFPVEDQAPDVTAQLAAATTSYQEAECPDGYLAATVVAHGDRFELQSPGAAIWWAGIVAASLPRLGDGAADGAQEEAWLDLAATSAPDRSSQAAVPDQSEIDRIAGCGALAPAATDLLQQQLYLMADVPLGEAFDEELEPLQEAADRINQLRAFSGCDNEVREHLLRSAGDIDFAGATAVVAYASELDASWTLWSQENLRPGLDLAVGRLDEETGEVGIVVTNVGNIPVRVLSVELAGVAAGEVPVALIPDESVTVPVQIGEAPSDAVDLVVQLQTPTGTTETQRASVTVEQP